MSGFDGRFFVHQTHWAGWEKGGALLSGNRESKGGKVFKCIVFGLFRVLRGSTSSYFLKQNCLKPTSSTVIPHKAEAVKYEHCTEDLRVL